MLDKGVDAVETFLNQVVIPQVEKGNYQKVRDYKTALQEQLQVNGDVAISYRVTKESGPAHAKVFEVSVFVNDKAISSGSGKSKNKQSKQLLKKRLSD